MMNLLYISVWFYGEYNINNRENFIFGEGTKYTKRDGRDRV